ncbi:MAG: discoidin domain-containing protein [Chloroflexota bacterium]|nr:discoidin domain-containing protein [Chloroflexota bacterium]
MSALINPSPVPRGAATQFPAYIYGLHDLGAEDLLTRDSRTGWILDIVDLSTQSGTDYSSLAQAGLGVIVRLDHGSGATGTIPPSFQYDAFAARCATYVDQSPGAHFWIIGNKMNTSAARPELPDGFRQVITPPMYARCFLKCRAAIRNVPGHATDWILPGAIAPYNAETGDWVQYFVDLLSLLNDQVDGIALHCYTHDFNVEQITSDDMMGAPYGNRHFNFRAYRDFLNALPNAFRSLPVFITETNPSAGWRDLNIGWIQAAYHEIDAWNADPSHQPIQALILFRWQTRAEHPEWGIQDKRALLADFQAALAAGYRARWLAAAPTPPSPSPSAPPPTVPDYGVEWEQVIDVPDRTMEANSTRTGRVVVTNKGRITWRGRRANPVRVGYRWYNAQGHETPVAPYAGNFSIQQSPVPPGKSAVFENVELRAPQTPGTYTLKWDLVHEGITWFGARGSATNDSPITVIPATPPPPAPAPPEWKAAFLAHDTPVSERAARTVLVNLRIKNTGIAVWQQGGAHPVHIGYKWYNAAGQPQLDVEDRRTALPTNIAPGDQVALGAILAAPKTPGNYTLHWDLVAEHITWFADAGSAPLVVPVTVTAMPIDVSGWRAETNWNPTQVALALDGDPRTFWDSSAPQTPGQWFRLNLSAPRMIDGIQFLSPGRGFPAGYALRVSGDGKAWTEIARLASGNAHDVMAVFSPQPIQYLQLDLLAACSSEWMISEILIHSAVAWKVSASHNGQAAHQAIDNHPDTAWSSNVPQTASMWFQIDLGRVERVSGILLDASADASPVNFRITTWNAAASRWQIAYEVTNNHVPLDVAFAPTPTQFINLQITAASDQPWTIQHARVIREMETWLGPSRTQ